LSRKLSPNPRIERSTKNQFISPAKLSGELKRDTL
jgi:hypothetical protein